MIEQSEATLQNRPKSRRERRKLEMARRKEEKKAQRLAQKALREKEALEGANKRPKVCSNNAKSPFKTVEEEQAENKHVAIDYLKTMQRLLPGLLKRLSEVEDYRNPKKIKHKVDVILLFAIFWFVFQKTSRREANREMTTPTFLENMRVFFNDLDCLPHHDTVNRFLSKVNINELENVLFELIKNFNRSKKFTKYLIGKCYPVAIDGTQKYAYHFLWAEECQERKPGGKTQYYCYCLEAALVFHNGIMLPLATEVLDYMEGDVNSNKQDCELKAFYRLAAKIKKNFPKLKIMVILDGLYPNGPLFELCREYRWQFMIVFPENCLKSMWKKFNNLQHIAGKMKMKWGNRDQEFTWLNNVPYSYGKKKQLIHIVVCEEQWDEVGEDGSIVHMQSKHAWISSEPLTIRNLHERCNLAGRHRWGIETGFLVEKRFGYQYEHTFSFNWNAMKGFHILMRIAHMINTLAQHSSLLKAIFGSKGMKAAIKYLDEIFRKTIFNPIHVMENLTQAYQVRLI
jgi:hypothetical protein